MKEEPEEADGQNEVVDVEQNDDNEESVEEATIEPPVVTPKENDKKLAQKTITADSKVKTKKKRVKRNKVFAPQNHKSISDEKLAYENTEKALLLLSKNLNKAHEGLNKTESTINEVNNTITDII